MSSPRADLLHGHPLEALESASRPSRVRTPCSRTTGARSWRTYRDSGVGSAAASTTVAPIYTCEWCFGPLEVTYDYEAIAAAISRESIAAGPLSIWRYQDLLPGGARTRRSISARASRRSSAPSASPTSSASARSGSRTTRVNPTNSFKDRVTSVALSKALEFGFKTAACASTGNLANSVAAHAAHAGIPSFVFIPANLEQGKVVTTGVYGGNVVAIDGNYDDVNRLCAEIAGTYPWAFVNVNVRTYYAEGSKTLAFETAEQLGWQTPDHVVVPVASGSLLTKIRKGFGELHQVGLLDDEPHVRVSGAQATGCSPVATAWREGTDTIKPVKPSTDRQVARDRQPGRRLLRDRRRALDRRCARRGHRRRDRRGHQAARPHRGDLRRDGGRRHDREPEEARRVGASSAPTSGSSSYITGHGLKTIEAVAPDRAARPRSSPRASTRSTTPSRRSRRS